MSHSVYSYLSRRTNEELEYALKICLEDVDTEQNRDMILKIIQILWERGHATGQIMCLLREKYGDSID